MRHRVAALAAQDTGGAGRVPAAAVSSRSSVAASADPSRSAAATPAGSASPVAAGRTTVTQSETAAPRAPAAQGTGQAAPASAVPVQRGLLREFLTVSDAGYFYTAYPPEAQSAVSKFHFQRTGASFGYIDASQAAGTEPPYRLHDAGVQAYLVTPDVSEKNSLLASGRFTLDGVLGYTAAKPAAGTFTLWRVSKGPQDLGCPGLVP
ncbi:MAG: hypothetical protein ACRDN0_06215 [Trebonia sp.]